MSNAPLKLGVTGLRGIAGESLTPEIVERYVNAFVHLMQPKRVVLGRDTRATGPEFRELVIERLRDYGCEIIDIGIVATPTAQFMVRNMQADAGIAITASHNPPEYNGLKFFDRQGMNIDESDVAGLRERYDRGDAPVGGKGDVSIMTNIDDADMIHMQHILRHIDVEKIKNSGLKIVIDPDGGAGAVAAPVLVELLGLDATIIHGNPGPEFPRGTEPTPENLKLLGEAVQEFGADVGFAQDPDADRLALTDENGKPIGEDYTLTFAVDYILSKLPDATGVEVATNLSTSRLIEDVCNKYGANLIYTKIGERYVGDALVETDGVIGGEGNGGVIWPVVGFGRDSFAGMAIILEYLATSGKKISELVAELPKYETVKTKKEISGPDEVAPVLDHVQAVFADQKHDLTDGVKVIFGNGWLHVRPSNTEPIIRFFAEAPTKEIAQSWVDKVLN